MPRDSNTRSTPSARCRFAAALALGLSVVSSGCVIDELSDDDVGEAQACEAARAWPESYAENEAMLLDLVNEARSRGGQCDGTPTNPVPDLQVAPALRCAARLHATYLADAQQLSHEGDGGSSTLARVDRAEYDGIPKHELLAADFTDPSAVLDAWLQSPSHCRALYDPMLVELGIGYAQSFQGDAAAWVLLTGQPRN